jgi:hypothetical protein
LHYFSDWIFDNGKKRVVQNVTAAVGGPSVVAKSLQVDFMTSHRPSYRQLANDAFFDSIRRQEQLISARTFVYIPKAAVLSISQNIRHGDILAMTTTMPGMDVSHTGIAYRTGDGAVHLLHAPVPGTKVRITDLPLSDYLAGNSKQTGIIVARPLEPQ